MIIQGNIVDIVNRRIFKGEVEFHQSNIIDIREVSHNKEVFILPGFVDAHIHIESSMLVPSEFAKIAVTHGTVATVSDPHEIANVLGVDGVRFHFKTPNNQLKKLVYFSCDISDQAFASINGRDVKYRNSNLLAFCSLPVIQEG